MCFVDLEKAFDRVPRGVLWGVLREYGVSDPLIRAVRSLYDRCQSLVRIAGVAGFVLPHATEVAFLGALRHRTRVDVVQDVYWEFQAGGIRRADGTNCHGCGASSSVCVDGWFILGAMITIMHHRCAAPGVQSNKSGSGQVRL